MKLTADANVFFSALIRDGATRKLIFNPELVLYSPYFVIEEFEKHRAFLRKKFRGSDTEFDALAEKILAQIIIVPDSELKAFIPAAASLIKDLNDIYYLACALKEDTFVWSNDKGFLCQKRVKVKSIECLLEELEVHGSRL